MQRWVLPRNWNWIHLEIVLNKWNRHRFSWSSRLSWLSFWESLLFSKRELCRKLFLLFANRWASPVKNTWCLILVCKFQKRTRLFLCAWQVFPRDSQMYPKSLQVCRRISAFEKLSCCHRRRKIQRPLKTPRRTKLWFTNCTSTTAFNFYERRAIWVPFSKHGPSPILQLRLAWELYAPKIPNTFLSRSMMTCSSTRTSFKVWSTRWLRRARKKSLPWKLARLCAMTEIPRRNWSVARELHTPLEFGPRLSVETSETALWWLHVCRTMMHPFRTLSCAMKCPSRNWEAPNSGPFRRALPSRRKMSTWRVLSAKTPLEKCRFSKINIREALSNFPMQVFWWETFASTSAQKDAMTSTTK